MRRLFAVEFRVPIEFAASAVGHREDEQSLPPVRCPDFRRREYSCRNPVAHAVKIAAD
jgi:hypothetical protein